jgi:hypothetical protein
VTADLKGLLARLTENDVEFVVVGGFAAVAHGSTLLTMDVDVCCDMSPDNLLRIQRAISDLHPVHRLTSRKLPLLLTAESCRGLRNLYLDTDIGPLDCLGEIAGVGGFPEVKARSVWIELERGRCRILALDALIDAKRAMGRPRDRETVAQLELIAARLRRARRRGM